VVFPAESYAEKEGTLVHPDGRLQRLRPAIGRPAGVRAGWQVLDELARMARADHGVHTVHSATQQLFGAVAFYAGLSVEAIGPKGVRWWEHEARAAAWPEVTGLRAALGDLLAKTPLGRTPEYDTPANGETGTALRLGTYKSIWAAPEVAVSPALKFLHPQQRVELAPADAERLDIKHGEHVTVGCNGSSVAAIAHLRDGSPAGSAFLQSGIPDDAANVLDGPLVEIRKVVRS